MQENSTPRTCVWCRSSLKQRIGESNVHYAKRQCCNTKCAGQLRWTRDALDMGAKTCLVCGDRFERKLTESTTLFRRSVTCSRTCGITLANRRRYAKVAPESKPCVICGIEIRKRDDEMPAGFRQRKTCGDICHFELISRQKIDHHADIRATPYPPEFTEGLKLLVRRRDGFVCQECGCVELPHRSHAVHHIDYDKNNCVLSNLVTLCQPCHVRTNANREYWTARFSA